MVGSNRFADDCVLVTGSNYGIGRGTAERFAQEGASVAITGRDADRAQAVADGIVDDGGEAIAHTADLAGPAAIRDLIDVVTDTFGQIDVLVNNAAIQTKQHVMDTDIEEWDHTLDVNVRGYWLTVKHALPHMPDGSAVVNVASNHAHETGPGMFPYNVTKTAIHGLTRAMALEFAPAIRVNTLASGWVPTGPAGAGSFDADRQQELAALHPVGRMGRPADIAGAIAFLASDDASFVTGTELLVDGGRSAAMYDRWLPAYGNDR